MVYYIFWCSWKLTEEIFCKPCLLKLVAYSEVGAWLPDKLYFHLLPWRFPEDSLYLSEGSWRLIRIGDGPLGFGECTQETTSPRSFSTASCVTLAVWFSCLDFNSSWPPVEGCRQRGGGELGGAEAPSVFDLSNNIAVHCTLREEYPNIYIIYTLDNIPAPRSYKLVYAPVVLCV